MPRDETVSSAGGARSSDAAPLVVTDQGAVRTLTLNRPEVRNALNLALLRQLTACLKEAEADPAVHAVILTGSGSSFCSGLDIKALRDPGWDPLAWNGTVATLLEASVPVIAAVNGSASTAGLGLMLACDFAVASEAATFVDMHAKLGLMSASGSASLLADRIGIARAKEMWITAKVVDAATASAWGLINDVTRPEDLLADVGARAAEAAKYDNAWVRAMVSTHDRGRRGTLAEHMTLEVEAATRWADRKR
jgi:enoyl-CoA hydratase